MSDRLLLPPRSIDYQTRLHDRLAEVSSKAANLERATTLDYTHLVGGAGEPAFQNNYANYGSGFAVVGFYLVRDVVHIQGLVTRSTGTVVAGETIFTLPALIKPGTEHIFAAWGNSGAGRVDITASGTVVNNSTSGASGGFLSLSGLRYRVGF